MCSGSAEIKIILRLYHVIPSGMSHAREWTTHDLIRETFLHKAVDYILVCDSICSVINMRESSPQRVCG